MGTTCEFIEWFPGLEADGIKRDDKRFHIYVDSYSIGSPNGARINRILMMFGEFNKRIRELSNKLEFSDYVNRDSCNAGRLTPWEINELSKLINKVSKQPDFEKLFKEYYKKNWSSPNSSNPMELQISFEYSFNAKKTGIRSKEIGEKEYDNLTVFIKFFKILTKYKSGLKFKISW